MILVLCLITALLSTDKSELCFQDLIQASAVNAFQRCRLLVRTVYDWFLDAQGSELEHLLFFEGVILKKISFKQELSCLGQINLLSLWNICLFWSLWPPARLSKVLKAKVETKTLDQRSFDHGEHSGCCHTRWYRAKNVCCMTWNKITMGSG